MLLACSCVLIFLIECKLLEAQEPSLFSLAVPWTLCVPRTDMGRPVSDKQQVALCQCQAARSSLRCMLHPPKMKITLKVVIYIYDISTKTFFKSQLKWKIKKDDFRYLKSHRRNQLISSHFPSPSLSRKFYQRIQFLLAWSRKY